MIVGHDRKPEIVNLDLDGLLNGSSLLGLSGNSLGTHDTTSPMSSLLLELGVVSLADCADQLAQLVLVFLLDLSQSNNSGSLLMNNGSESGLALDDGIWHTHLSAESWEVDDELDWVNIVRDQDQSGLLVLDESNNVVETVLDGVWLLADILLLLAVCDSSSFGLQTLLLLCLGLWSVLVEQLQCLSGCVSVEGVVELGNRGWDLQSQVEDLLLSLETNILWPSRWCQWVLVSALISLT